MREQFEQYSDIEIINKVLNGELKLYEILIRRYNSFLYKIGRSYHYNHEDTEDLMQETFIKAYENLSKLKNSAYFKTWLIRIMLNECYRRTKKSSVKNEVATEIFSQEKIIPMFSDNNNDTEKKNSQQGNGQRY